jgi:hypothetical protein
MSLDALHSRIGQCWDQLLDLPHGRVRTVWLTSCGHLVATWQGEQSLHAVEVGTYSRAVRLADFREDVLDAYEQQRRTTHGRSR